jgi:hypothetical protein
MSMRYRYNTTRNLQSSSNESLNWQIKPKTAAITRQAARNSSITNVAVMSSK